MTIIHISRKFKNLKIPNYEFSHRLLLVNVTIHRECTQYFYIGITVFRNVHCRILRQKVEEISPSPLVNWCFTDSQDIDDAILNGKKNVFSPRVL